MLEITDEMNWALVEAGMSSPIPLSKAIRTKPFIYCREYGLFYVDSGSHQVAASLLLAWSNGFKNILQAGEHFGMHSLSELSEKWLEVTDGALILSSVGKTPYANSRRNLNFQENKFFRKITYLDE